MNLTPEEKAAIDSISITSYLESVILGTPDERIKHLMPVAVMFFRERNEARAVARILLAQIEHPNPQYIKSYSWLDTGCQESADRNWPVD